MRRMPEVWIGWNHRHESRKVGIGIAFALGLLMDVHDASLLGEHALAYTQLSYGAIMIHRRVLWFPLPAQVLHVLPLLVLAHMVPFIIRVLMGAAFLDWKTLLSGFICAALW